MSDLLPDSPLASLSPRRSAAGKFYLGIWGLLGLAAGSYLALMLVKPEALAVSLVKWPDQRPVVASLEATLAQTRTRQAALDQTVTTLRSETAGLKAQLAQRQAAERALQAKVAALEEQLVVARAQPVARVDPRKAARDEAKARREAALKPELTAPADTGPIITVPGFKIETSSVQPQPSPRQYAIRLNTGPSLDALRLSWAVLTENHGKVLRSLSPRYVQTQGAAGAPAYQLVAGPFKDSAAARRACRALAAKGIACSPTNFAGGALQ